MSAPSVHDDWLSLIEISGPFLAVPVLKEAFPQGLEELDATRRKRLRQAYEEWREALELEDAQFAELHVAWIDEVLSRGLALDEDGKGDVLKRADWCAANLQTTLPEHGVKLSPDLVVVDEQRANKPLMLIQTYSQDIDLDTNLKQDGWSATPADRMVALCRSLGCRLGLVTNGERWMLVDAPVGAVTNFASWYARIWSQEPITLQAFVHLLGIRHFFVDESEQLPALFDRSLKFQDEVTDALGEQVRRAIEVLIQTLDKADQDRNRELLHEVKEPELYEAALTVMMRLVFLLSAEERGLLLMGDERYEANYALSTLRMQLRKESEEILERRWDAWSRLLAIFRAVFSGIDHENLRLPALGGPLFDPDRFPFLEGRAKGSNWRSDAAKPLPIDNRTVLLLLEAIQLFQGRTLSYRALDVEQIGYVYEGLLERTVKRTNEVTLELDATKSAKTPWINLAELDSAQLNGAMRLVELLQERSGSSASRVRNDLAKPVDDTLADRLLTACLGDTKLRDRVKPYAHLLRTDPWGYPLVYPAGAYIVTTGSDRRETGTHYTPKSLTEAIVAETLTPVAYVGPAEGKPREQWALKSPAKLLALKICDPAMGSGAFLVQACRWLSDRLVEAWSQVEASGQTVSVDGEVLAAGTAKEPLPRDSEARTVIARRLIAERCLYGVDLNPLAVELAKLSIWLVTLAKGRPFGFLDHNLRCGDSLLGINRLDQLTELSMTPSGKGQQRLFGKSIEKAVHEAIELRHRLREMPIRDIHDVEAMARLNNDAQNQLRAAELVADSLIGEVYRYGKKDKKLQKALNWLAIQADQLDDASIFSAIAARTRAALSSDLLGTKLYRQPFQWPLEFPEIFCKSNGGFDSIVANPPFAEGDAISPLLMEHFKCFYEVADCSAPGSPSTSVKANLLTSFIERAVCLLKIGGTLGLVSPKPFLRNERYWRARQYLLEKTTLKQVFNLPSGLFLSASVETCAIIARKESQSCDHQNFRVINTASPTLSFDGSLQTAKSDKYFVIRIESSIGAAAILSELEAKSTKLEEYFEIKDGINPGRKDFRQYFLGKKVGDMFVPNAHMDGSAAGSTLAAKESFVSEIHKKTINGRDFSAYSQVDWDGTYLRYHERYAYVEQFFVTGTRWSAQLREKTHFDRGVKVITRQTANSLIATIDENRLFPLNTVHVHFPKQRAEENGYNCFVLCGILNSKLLRFYYRTKSEEVGAVFPQVHISKLRELPIPRTIDVYSSSQLTELVKRALFSGDEHALSTEINDLIYTIYAVDIAVKGVIEAATAELLTDQKASKRARRSKSTSQVILNGQFGGDVE